VRPAPIATLLLLAAALAACSTSAPAASGIPFEGDGMRFVAPPGWDVRTSTMLEYGPGSRVGYLANQPLHDDCTGDPQVCPGPVDALRDAGMLIVWLTINCAGPRCEPPPGPLTTVGGRIASIADIPGTACPPIGQTEETVYVVAVSPQRLDTIVVCARWPSAGTRATLRAFLDAVDWRTP
jgi:hypothetical protein